MPFFVSRQHTWPTGQRYVEVTGGGRDHANPDMLVERYRSLGEGKEFDDPREAVEAAIAICRAWRKDARDRRFDVRTGSTGGFTMPFERGTFRDARAWARAISRKLPRCGHCDEILGRRTYRHELADDGEVFCSERCAEADHDGRCFHGADREST